MATQARGTNNIVHLSMANRPRTIEVVRKIKVAIDKKVGYLLDGLLFNVVDALFEETLGLDEEMGLRHQFNICRAMKTLDAPYRDQYFALMNLSWANLIDAKVKAPVPDPDEEVMSSLRLYSARNTNQYKILLGEIGQRFCTLASKDELEFHPLMPLNFYLCFWYSTEQLNLSMVERKLLLPLFDRFVMDRFGKVLSIANQGMAELEVAIAPK
ncbi:MAG: DUF1631 domain-containing protein [Pseudomonadales bacterium]|nr:DUF1631 domain-containing protein [Pseudomonadales bacterium]